MLASHIGLSPAEWLRARRRGLTRMQLTDAVTHLLEPVVDLDEAVEQARAERQDLFSAGASDTPAPQPSQALRDLMTDVETPVQAVQRLRPVIEAEWDAITNEVLWGAGNRVLDEATGKTVSQRHSELSALKTEMERIGAAQGAANG